VGDNRRLKKIHNEKVYVLYFLSDIIRVIKLRRIRWTRHVTHMGNMRNAYKSFVTKSEKRKRSANIKMECRRLRCHCVYWIDWVQGSDISCTLLTMILNLWVSLNMDNILTG
jgi:hypothetical protein